MGSYVDTGSNSLPAVRPVAAADIHSSVALVESDTGTKTPVKLPPPTRSTTQRR